MKHSRADILTAIFMALGVEYMTSLAIAENARSGRWVWFVITLVEFSLLNWIFGWCIIETFNKRQRRRRRRAQKAHVPEGGK